MDGEWWTIEVFCSDEAAFDLLELIGERWYRTDDEDLRAKVEILGTEAECRRVQARIERSPFVTDAILE